jgi:uncharacterized repeat protein (TIGR03803 family)
MTNPVQPSTSILDSKLRGRAFALALICALIMVAAQSAQAQTYSVLHSFSGLGDGDYPYAGLSIDRGGNLYGTAFYGGPGGSCGMGCGTAFRLAQENSGWLFSQLYGFRGVNDGGNPYARVVVGPDGSLYGTTYGGGGGSCEGGCGTVFNLRPPQHATANTLGNWTETVLYRFTGGSDGSMPAGADLTFDAAGNIYGTTTAGGTGNCQGGCGTVYKLTQSGGGWTESVLHSFITEGGDGLRPWGGVIFDQSGNLYGTTNNGGTHDIYGTVYRLTPSGSGWTESILYNFQGASDGKYPYSGLIFDQAGNLYGTTCCGGTTGGGTAFELLRSSNWAFSLVYSFTGSGPFASLSMDAAGDLYGTTNEGGVSNFGAVFKLTPSENGWTYTSLYDFCPSGGPCPDGSFPLSTVVFDSEGNLYGTTSNGGMYDGGTAWKIIP